MKMPLDVQEFPKAGDYPPMYNHGNSYQGSGAATVNYNYAALQQCCYGSYPHDNGYRGYVRENITAWWTASGYVG